MIRRFLCYSLIAGTLAVPCARAQDAAATIKTAEYALGMIRGPQRVDAVSTLEYWGTGSAYAFGQSYRPDSPWPAFKVTYHASLSYAVPAMRVDVCARIRMVSCRAEEGCLSPRLSGRSRW